MIRATFRLALLSTLASTLPAATPAWPGAAPPTTPEPFAHELPLTAISVAPGGRLLVLSAIDVGADGKVAIAIHEARPTGAEWSSPVRVPALARHPGGEAAFSPDGRWLYFSSDHPPAAPGRPRAFRSEVKRAAIGAPSVLDFGVAPEAGVYFPRPLPNGDVLFTSRGPVGGDDLLIARARDGGFHPPEPLGGDFNSARDDWDLVESADGRVRIWASAREGGLGRTDLYFSRRDASGRWSPARNLRAVNTPQLETAPSLTPGGEALFFLRRVDGRDRMFWVSLAAALED